MKRQLTWFAVVLMMCVCQASAATHYVGTCENDSYATINEAINIAAPGDVVKVCPGSYREQVIISKSLTLEGMTVSGQGLVQIYVPTSANPETTTSTVTGSTLSPIIWVVGASVNISDILVGEYDSGGACAGVPPVYNVGFYYGNGSSGTLNNTASNISCGAGVWLENSSDLGGGTVKVENSAIWGDFYGIFAGGGPHQTGTMPLLRATITGNQVGHEQYGIYLWDIGGTVSNNGIVFSGFAPAHFLRSVGVSDAAPDAVVTGNRMVQEITGIDVLAANEIVTSNHIQSDGGTKAGIDLHCFLGNVSNNTLQIRGSAQGSETSFGLTDVPAGFAKINHFYNTALLQSSGSC